MKILWISVLALLNLASGASAERGREMLRSVAVSQNGSDKSIRELAKSKSNSSSLRKRRRPSGELLSYIETNVEFPVLAEATIDIPTDEPSATLTGEPTGTPSDIPSDVPSLTPSGVPSGLPTDIPTTTPTSEPTDALQRDEASIAAAPIIPRCDLTKKVGYKCGNDTIVCNAGPSAPANEVCDLQPVLPGGKLFTWTDSIAITSGKCEVGEDDCWCKSMANGVSKPGPDPQLLFPWDVLCPNGEYVESYVCYNPFDGEEMYFVDRIDYGKVGSWTTPCSGFQPLDELPPVHLYTTGEAGPVTPMPSSTPTVTASDIPSDAPSETPSGVPSSLPTEALQRDEASIAAAPIIPRCDLTKKVGYKCGDDTIVCNAGPSAPANEVCDLQPVLPGGKLFEWIDSIAITSGKCEVGEDDCWCKSMANGVSKPGPDPQLLFPWDVLCPNGEFVESYVCYNPFDGEEMFFVDRIDYDKVGSWTTPCTGFQPQDELPPVHAFALGEAVPATPIPSSIPTEATSDVPSDEPSALPSVEPTSPPSNLPSDEPSATPTGVPTDIPTATPTSEPTEVFQREDASIVAAPMIPICDLTKKVGYKCGDDTIVCNASPISPANEVCDLQPVLPGGKLYSVNDTVAITSGKCGAGEDGCWCKSMANGVSRPGSQPQALFPWDVLCPNGEYVESYVCYNPFDGGRMFFVDRFDYDKVGSWSTPCTGFQRRDELPPVLVYATVEASPTASPPSSTPTVTASDVPSDAPSVVPSGQPTGAPSNIPSDAPSVIPSGQPTGAPSNIPSDVPSVIPSGEPTGAPSNVPSDAPSDTPTGVPTDIPTATPTSEPTEALQREDASIVAAPMIPRCDLTKKVGYKCGDDTIVCNASPISPANEVCDLQPVLPGGKLYSVTDTVAITSGKCGAGEDGCWCKSMANGVSRPGSQPQALFPWDVLCPNGEYVESYVCYNPFDGGRMFFVDRFDYDKVGSWSTPCTGFQLRDELPPVLVYATVEASPTASPPSSTPTVTASDVPSDAPSIVPSGEPTAPPSDVSESVAPTSIPSGEPTDTFKPSIVPSASPTTSMFPSSEPASSQTQISSPSIPPLSNHTMKETVPDCQFDKKVGYQCGADTIVCNAQVSKPAEEVCDKQPVLDGGRLFAWKDTIQLSNNQSCDIGNEDCWCQFMALGVSSPSNEINEMFPSDIACPNGMTVSSYVCYSPSLGGSIFKVNQVEILDDLGETTFVEPCTGYQRRNELPPVTSYTTR
ncbi:PT repeat/fibro-slime domain containing protein [Nitzschia inconspicua]|uniref:Circumsporozoite protein n=1 Tax=Nitzschia inconspicua TaxID=303405 RepID=A0A9K3KMY7_9STRA|nr:PT repeat/fibro-slime domain containing protein [Nitzschia inconspicua]